MKTKLGVGVCALALTLAAAGCSTVGSRIEKNRAQYETWPLPVREKVAAGQIDLGFTTEQVAVALGQEHLVAAALVGGVLILGGVALVNRKGSGTDTLTPAARSSPPAHPRGPARTSR